MWGDLCGVGHWNVKYFVLTPDILWMNQPCDHLLGRIYPIPGDPATSAARVETGLPCPAQLSLGSLSFSPGDPEKFGSGGPGLAGLHHGHMEQQK